MVRDEQPIRGDVGRMGRLLRARPMTRVIGLAGRAGSGKSTCGEWLQREYGAWPFSLAEPLKMLARDLYGFSHEQVFGSQAQKEAVDPRHGLSPRQVLITLGNAARTHLGEDVWLNACLDAIRRSGVSLAVITDVRYPNEAAAISKIGHVIRLSCPDADTAVDPNAPSERSVDTIDASHIAAEIVATRSPGAKVLLDMFAASVRPFLGKTNG